MTLETASLEISDVESFDDYETTFFPYLKELNTPTLADLYARVDRAKNTQLALYGGAIVAGIGAACFMFQPLYACTLGVIAIACSVSTLYFQKPPPYLILSIDGGGIRGNIPIQILTLIEEKLGCKIGEVFDLITGTSIGGIIALALTLPDPQDPSKPKMGAKEVAQFIQQQGPNIFEQSRYQSITSLDGIRAPKYSNENLKASLQTQFGDTKLDDAVTDVLITSYDLIQGKPAIFYHFKGEKTANPFLMKDIGMATSAAPTYFPSYPVRNLNLIDGGLVANNPALIAYMKAAGHIDPRRDIFILSVGTGEMPMKAITPEQSENYGMIQWLPIILDLIFQSAQEMTTLQFKLLKHTAALPVTVVRLQPQITKPSQENLDNTSPDNILELRQIATNYFEANRHWIEPELIQPLAVKVKTT